MVFQQLMTYLFVCCCSGLTATATADAVTYAELFEMVQDLQEVVQARTMSGSSAGRVRSGGNSESLLK